MEMRSLTPVFSGCVRKGHSETSISYDRNLAEKVYAIVTCEYIVLLCVFIFLSLGIPRSSLSLNVLVKINSKDKPCTVMLEELKDGDGSDNFEDMDQHVPTLIERVKKNEVPGWEEWFETKD